ncbi:helix-turn-helix domain-containing protein [Paenibacillaceae bacterium WGS1546]|uniref:AraC family transcriptional regulator n=1 Tax=Cohnella sp. WGS1546 TaxID=3366810 RepID=UPI00372D2AA5
MRAKPFNTLKGDAFFSGEWLVYVNRASEDFDVPLHNHDFVEIAFVAEGAGFHHIGDRVHPVRKGDLIFIPIGVPHVFRPSAADKAKHPLTVYNCVLSPKLLERLEGFVSDPAAKRFIASLSEPGGGDFQLTDADDTLARLMLILHREYSLPKAATADYLNALLLQLLLVMLRLKHRAPSPAARKFTSFDRLLSYMDQNPAEDLSLSRLSAISPWSERHLRRLFLSHTQQSFNSYLQALRVRKSCELLRTTPHKIGSIAEMVGYRDNAAFLAVFKRLVGQTPSEYRKSFP